MSERKVDPVPPNPHRFDELVKTFGEKKHIAAMFDSYRALIDQHGWREIMYCPKDGTPFEVITVGSIGVFRGRWLGDNNDLLFVEEAGDLWPAQGMLFRLCSPTQNEAK